MKNSIQVGCYVRVSTENQIENYSIDEQIERLSAYCTAKDWTVYKFYTDAGYSGGNIDRPALKQMINDLKLGLINLIVVYKLDRLSRSQKDTLTLIEDEFLANNVDFVSINENFDTTTPFGRAMIGILSVFAQLEKDQITERFTMGRIGRSKAGYYHGGPTPPTGYNYIEGKLKIDVYKAAQVREVYSRFLKGQSLNSIQNDMHKRYGGWSSASLVLNVLRNSAYIGKVKFKGIEYEGIHESIIDEDTFSRVKQLLAKRQKYEPFKAKRLLTSIVYCKMCGARYSSCHGYYKCYSRSKCDKKYIIDPTCKNANWKIEELDSFVINSIEQLRHDRIYQKPKKHRDNSENIKAQIKDTDNQISKLIDLYQIKNMPVNELSKRIKALQKEKDNLQKMLAIPQDNNIDVFEILNRFEVVFEKGGLNEQRYLVRSLIERIIIEGDKVSIAWKV